LKAKKEADGQLEKAKNQISVEKDKALLEIRQEVVDLSIAVAEKIIKKNISKDDNASIIEDSLNKLDNYEA
jgi:F-type H+-transporting ATPase subunit b